MATSFIHPKRALFFALLLAGITNATSQNVAITDDNSYTADAAAMLDVKSTTKGMLVPRVALVSTTNPISGTKPNGLLVWNTLAGTYTVGYYFWNGSDWSLLGASASNGLTLSNGSIGLGGSLTQSTNITLGNYNMIFNVASTGYFSVYNTAYSNFTFLNSGFVGIGTIAPEHDLHIRGYNTNTAGTDGTILDIQNRYTAAGTMSGIRFANNSTGGTYFRSGIFYKRTNSPVSADGDLVIANTTNEGVDFTDAAITIKPDKKVGIGTSSPSATLHVNGTAMLSTGAAVNEFSTDDKFLGNSDLAVPTEKAVKTYVTNIAGTGFTGSGTSNYLPVFTSSTAFGNSLLYQSTNKIGIGTTSPTSKLVVLGNNGGTEDDAIFEVKNDAGQTVFAVYPKGVQIYVQPSTTKGTKTGFAVGGFSTGKAMGQEYLRVTEDSVRIYVDESATKGKGTKTGFAVGGFSTGKGITQNLLHLVKENYFIGHNSGTKCTATGKFNNFFGYEAGRDNTNGTHNVFIGYAAGAMNTDGISNIAIGNIAGAYNTTGDNNISVGFGAGVFLKGGDNNICIGNYAGIGALQAANNNTVIGVKAGQAMTTAKGNTLIGYNAGNDMTTGYGNICIGDSSGYQMTIAAHNVTMGSGAGVKLKDQSESTYIGFQSGISVNGSRNTFLGSKTGGAGNTITTGTGQKNTATGYYGLYNLTTGNYNTVSGCYAGWNISTGANNAMFGYYAGGSNNGSGNVFLGNYAGYYESGSNRLYIDNNYNTSTSTLIYGEFDNDFLRFNGNVAVNDAPGTNYGIKILQNNTSGSNYGIYSISNGATTSSNYGVYGYATSSTYMNRGGYFYGYNSASGTTNYGIYAYGGGGTSYAGYFSGNVYVSGTFSNPSDIRLKKDIKPINNALDKIMAINGVYYYWDIDAYKKLKSNKTQEEGQPEEPVNLSEGQQTGVIAQELEKVLPEAVTSDENGIKGVDYTRIVPLLIEAIKEQQAEIEALKKMINKGTE